MWGVIYHNLGLQFRTPTVNLFIAGEDYLQFAKDLPYYVSHKLVEQMDSRKNYPVGCIEGDETHNRVTIHFLHYQSFEEAKTKWEERAERINWDNLYFVWEFYDDQYDISLLREFDCLPIRKMCIVHSDIPGIRNKCVIKTKNKPGKLFEYEGLTGKKYLDKFDYVRFLNS